MNKRYIIVLFLLFSVLVSLGIVRRHNVRKDTNPISSPTKSSRNGFFLNSRKIHPLIKSIQQQRFQGRLEIEIVDNFIKARSYTNYYLRVNKEQRVKLYFSDKTLIKKLRTGLILDIGGHFFGLDGFTVFDLLPTPQDEDQEEDVLSGPQRILVVLAEFQDAENNASRNDINNAYFGNGVSVKKYYNDISFNQISIQGEVLEDIYAIPLNRACEGLHNIDKAVISEIDPDVNFNNIDYLAIIAPYNCPDWSGIAITGKVYVDTDEGEKLLGIHRIDDSLTYPLFTETGAHELGHNFGLDHSKFYFCGNDIYLEEGCETIEYGDPYNIMGTYTILRRSNALGFIPGPYKEFLGWLSQNELLEVQTNGMYHLSPYELRDDDFPKVLKIPVSNSETVYVEYRRPLSYDADFGQIIPANYFFETDVYEGALIHVVYEGNQQESFLLDMSPPAEPNNIVFTPPPAAGHVIAATPVLQDGERFSIKGVTLEASNPTDTGLWIRVTFPEIEIEMSQPRDGATVSGTITLRASVDAHGAEVEKVEFYLDSFNNLIGTATLAPYEVRLDTTKIFNGNHTLGAIVYDAAGRDNNTAYSEMITITVNNNDSINPTVSIIAPRDEAHTLSPFSVHIESRDNNGIAQTGFVIGNKENYELCALYFEFDDSIDISLESYEGDFSLVAYASDFAGNGTLIEQTFSIDNNPLPLLTITKPESNSTIRGSQLVSVASNSLEINSRQGLVENLFQNIQGLNGSVIYYLDTYESKLYETDSWPYNFLWNTRFTPNGLHHIFAEAHISPCYQVTSEAIPINVNNPKI